MTSVLETWLDPAARVAALQEAGVPATSAPTRHVRVRAGETATIAFDVVDESGAAAPAYVRLPLGADGAAVSNALADKWSRLRPVPAPRDLGEGVRTLPRSEGVLFFFPNDAGLRGLKDVVDLDRLKRTLAELRAFDGRVRVKAGGATLRTLRWKPERRFVGLFDGKAKDAGGTSHPFAAVVRFFPDERGLVLDRLAGRLQSTGVPSPRPFGVADGGRLYAEAYAPGLPLAALEGADATAAARPVASALAALHRAPILDALRILDPLSDVREAAEEIGRRAPALRSKALALADAIAARAPGDAPRSIVHGDVHAGQFLIDGPRATIVDFERAALGDPLVDVGALVAETLLLVRASVETDPKEVGFLAAFLTAYAEASPVRDRSALAFHAAAALATRAAAPFRRAAADPEKRAADILRLAENLLAPHPATTTPDRPRVDADARPAGSPKRPGSPCPSLEGRAPLAADAARPPGAVLEAVYVNPDDRGPWPCAFSKDGALVAFGSFDPSTGDARVVRPEDDRAVPALAAHATRGVVLARRVGKRATLRVDGPGGPTFVKLYSRGRFGRAAAALETARSALRASVRGDRPRLPDVVAIDPESGLIAFAPLPGTSLESRLRTGGDAFDALRRAARAAAAFHRAPLGPLRSRERYEAPPTSWRELVRRHAPDSIVAGPLSDRFDAVLAALSDPPPTESLAYVHGDLHDGNVFVAEDGVVGWIDLDLLHEGDPARDVGNLAAHAVLRRLHALATGPTPASDEEVADAEELGRRRADVLTRAYLEAGGATTPAAAAAFAAHASFRLACLYVFRRGSGGVVGPMLRAAERFAAEARR